MEVCEAPVQHGKFRNGLCRVGGCDVASFRLQDARFSGDFDGLGDFADFKHHRYADFRIDRYLDAILNDNGVVWPIAWPIE